MYRFDPGSTGVSLYFKLRDSNTGLAKKGLAYNSAGAQAAYTRCKGSATAITLSALASPTAPWAAGGFAEVDQTKSPGVYRVDFPDAALAAGVPYVLGHLAFGGAIEETVLCRLESSASLAGSGALVATVTVTDTNSTPLQGAAVWVSTDAAGTNVIAGTLYSNSAGQVTFNLNAGTYYLWIVHQGYTGTNPTTWPVS